jgi:hypothetical protein
VKDLKGQVEFIDTPDAAVVVIGVLLHCKFLSKPGRGISLNDVYTVNDPSLQATASPVRWPLTAIELLVSVHRYLIKFYGGLKRDENRFGTGQSDNRRFLA